MENNEHNHDNPGFGKNTNGLGILIITVVFVALSLSAWYFWNSATAEYNHYRVEKKEGGHKEGKAEAGH